MMKVLVTNLRYQMTKHQKILALLGWILTCFGTSAIGAAGSLQAKSFHAGLTQPDWAPPGWLFGPVWTILFAMMAIAIWRVCSIATRNESRIATLLFLAQLALNALWSWLFFAWQSGSWAFVNIILLWGLIVSCIVFFWRTSKLGSLLLVPYLCWVSFAAMLNYSLWQMNTNLLS